MRRRHVFRTPLFVSALAAVALIAGCSTTTGPLPAGDGSFVVYAHGGVPLLSQARAKTVDKCAGLGKKPRFVSEEVNATEAKVVFTCD